MATRYADPKMEAKIVQDLQDKLDTVTWLTPATNYPIAFIGTTPNEENPANYPRVYNNDNTVNYTDVRPDDNFKTITFFEINEPYEFLKDEQDVDIDLSLIVWYNLKTTVLGKTYDYGGELRAEIVELLRDNGIDSDIEVEIRPTEIFDKYSGLVQDYLKYLGYPYSAFKLTFTANQDINCLT